METNKPVVFYGKHGLLPAKNIYSLPVLNNILSIFYNEQYPGLSELFEFLDIKANVSNAATSKAKDRFNINKAVALEVFITQWLAASDSPIKSISNCVLNTDRQIINFAQKGDSDVSVDYGNFKLNTEVSAKRTVTKKDYLKQLNSSLKHIGDAKFVLLVTNKALYEEGVFSTCKKFLEQNSEIKNKDSIIPISTSELLTIGYFINEKMEKNVNDKPTNINMRKVFNNLKFSIQNAIKYNTIEKYLILDSYKNGVNGVDLSIPPNNDLPPPTTMM